MSKRKVLLSYSGGLDSTVALYFLKRNYQVKAVGFDYGQKNAIELDRAQTICSMASVPFERRVLDPQLFYSTSSILKDGEELPLFKDGDDLWEQHIIPARNMVFLTLLAIQAFAEEYDNIALGIIKLPLDVYPDCTPAFVRSMARAVSAAFGAGAPNVLAPVLDYTKEEVIQLAETMAGCKEAVELSYTCYRGGSVPCGVCEACDGRQTAYRNIKKGLK